MANTRKRMLSLVLSLVMALSLLPVDALVEGERVKVGIQHYECMWNPMIDGGAWQKGESLYNQIRGLKVDPAPTFGTGAEQPAEGYCVQVPSGEDVTKNDKGFPQITMEGIRWTCVGFELYYTGIEKTERYLWEAVDIAAGSRTLTLQSAGVNQANIQYMWVPEGKGQGEQTNIPVTVDFLPAEWRAELAQQGMEITENTTIALFGKNALSINSGVHLVAGIADGSLTEIPGIALTDGKMTIQWPDGYPIKPENIFQGYTAICVKIVTGTKEAYYGFTGWSGGSATAAEGLTLAPNPVYNHLYVFDRETIYDAEIQFQNVVTTASSASREQFSAAKSKIHFEKFV